jgi:cytochrome c
LKIFIISFLILALTAHSAYTQDATKGEIIFKKCIACHAVGENARNKTGPVLNGLFGRKAGSVEDYNYSPAMKDSGIVWDEEDFTTYITNPHLMIPATKMAFAGLSDPQEIKDLIAYLKQFPKP